MGQSEQSVSTQAAVLKMEPIPELEVSAVLVSGGCHDESAYATPPRETSLFEDHLFEEKLNKVKEQHYRKKRAEKELIKQSALFNQSVAELRAASNARLIDEINKLVEQLKE